VKVSKLVPFRDDVSFSDEDVDRLHLAIHDETAGSVYPLTSQGGGGLYAGGDFRPEAGHAYRLQFAYDGVQVTAATQVAPLPENAQCPKTTITAGFGGSPGGSFDSEAMEPVAITWDNPSADYYIVTAACDTSAAYTPVRGEPNETSAAPLWFRSEVTQGTSIQLSPQSFSYYGTYTIKLCRIQPEYVLLCQRMNSRSENLAELNANVVNGYGIFTGIGSKDFRVHVISN
jgi:hypothetical protein